MSAAAAAASTTTHTRIHPLVRDLYKRALLVGRDYPLGLDYVRKTWKQALRNPNNTPSCYYTNNNQKDNVITTFSPDCEREIRKAVGKGRFMIREMVGIIQLKKYRAMNKRYGGNQQEENAMRKLEEYVRQQQNQQQQQRPPPLNGTQEKTTTSNNVGKR